MLFVYLCIESESCMHTCAYVDCVSSSIVPTSSFRVCLFMREKILPCCFSRQSHRQNCEEVLSQSKPRDGMDPGIGSIVAPFWGLPYRILNMNTKKELLWSLRAGIIRRHPLPNSFSQLEVGKSGSPNGPA